MKVFHTHETYTCYLFEWSAQLCTVVTTIHGKKMRRTKWVDDLSRKGQKQDSTNTTSNRNFTFPFYSELAQEHYLMSLRILSELQRPGGGRTGLRAVAKN